jgi:hypothetical protein
MYLEGVLVEARNLVNGASIVQDERVDRVDYFHLELDGHDVILAEGALSETFIDDGSRGMFHNAHEYDALYPGGGRPPARYYAPRLADGYEVETIRRHIGQRAGLPCCSESSGALRGYVDLVGPDRICGWAQNVDHPEAPVCLDIYVGGRSIGQVLANQFRDDLKQAGLGSGCHSFDFALPAGIRPAPGAVQVRRSFDSAALTPPARAAA